MGGSEYAPLITALRGEFEAMIRTRTVDFQKLRDAIEPQFHALGFREPQERGVENILVLRMDAMGDFILTSGFIRELRMNYPSARITLLVSDYIYPIAELCPYVNEVLHFNMNEPLLIKNPMSIFGFTADFATKHLWRRRFTKCINVQAGGNKVPSTLMSYFSGAAERIGYVATKERDISELFCTRRIISPKEIVHEAAKSLHILTALGLSVKSRELELWYGAEDVLRVRRLLKDFAPTKMRIAIGLGAGNRNRKYPVNRYIEALSEIGARDASFILFGGAAEADDARIVHDGLIERGCDVINLVGALNLRETVAALAMTDMYIGNDSGVMHAAAAAKLPVIVIYREAEDKGDIMLERSLPSEYYMFAPWRTLSISLRPKHSIDECVGAYIYGGCVRDEPHCISQVSPSAIVEAFDTLRYIASHNPKR